MEIEVYNSYAYVTNATATEDKWMSHALSHRKTVRGYGGIAKGTEELTLYDPIERSFPSGLCVILSQMSRDVNIQLFFKDKRRKVAAPKDVNLLFLKDSIRGVYQKAAIEAAITWGRGIWHCPTGFGKTMLAIGLAKRVPVKWGFIVDEATLLGQTIDRWNAWDFDDEPAGVLGDGRWVDRRFVVATYQTINERAHEPEIERWIKSVEGVVFDEGHVLAAPTYFRAAQNFTQAYYRIALSATPLVRSPWDNLHVIGATGRVIYKANVAEMVAAGVLSMPFVTMEDFNHKEADSPTWQGVYGELIVKNTARNNRVTAITESCAKPALVFVKQLNHGADLLQRILKKGIKAELVVGEASLKERRAAIGRLMAREIEVIVTNKIFQKGVDIPDVRTVVVASGGKSVVDSLQRVGRGMRIAKDKENLAVFDLMDRGNEWLLHHSRERKRAYTNAGFQFTSGALTLPFTT